MRILAALILIGVGVGCGGKPQHEFASMSSVYSAGANCDETLQNQYSAKIYPFFRQESTCVKCHVEGGIGLGLFASQDSKISFSAFSAAGASKVRYMATNPQHKPPYTGSQNQAAVDAWANFWTKSQQEYIECTARATGGTNESLLTGPQGAPSIYAARDRVETLTWNLDTAEDLAETVQRSLPAAFSIDVKLFYQSNIARGYIFSNPVLQLKDGSKQVLVEGISLYINGQLITSQTTFANVSRIVTGTLAIPLMAGAQASTFSEPLSTSDTFQFYFRRLALTSGGEEASPPLTPILKVFDSETGSSTLIKNRDLQATILRDAGILRWCLKESPTAPADMNDPCWVASRPDSFDISAGDGARSLYLWVANQGLKINTTPARVDYTLDTTPPSAPSIGSITVSDTQVAAMSVSHGNESDVTGWCVIEQNAILSAPARPDLKDKCWSWTDNGAKPTTVGFKEGGARRVWVYVRDKAGNVSAASSVAQASNPFGAITFTQLTNPAGGSRAIFQNRCFTCHGSNANPGYSQLQLFNYEAALVVAESGTLISRINNPLSPMPNVNGGLMPQRERDLIRLWVTPEEGDQPLQ